MAATSWRHAVEIHPPDWICPAAPFWIAGWIVAPSGPPPIDVRAWLGSKLFLGLANLPRPEIEQAHPGPAAAVYAGFCFLLEPVAGATELRLEAYDTSGHWREFHHQRITVPPDTQRTSASIFNFAKTLIKLLAAHTVQPRLGWSALADNVLTSEHAVPLNSLPNPPFYGALEQPLDIAWVRYGHIAITGWVAHREHPIVSLTALVAPTNPVALLHGLPRLDAGELFADLHGGSTSRFAGYLTIPPGTPEPACLRIFAKLANGEIHLVFAQRLRTQTTTGANSGLPGLSRIKFWLAARALQKSANRRGWPLGSPDAISDGRKQAWQAYAAESPLTSPTQFSRSNPPAENKGPRRITLVTHNLNREGAPLIAYEFACHLAAQPGWQIRIVSPQDGPLRQSFISAGLPVELIDIQPLLAAASGEEYKQAVAQLAAGSSWAGCDLIIANTMVAFWAIHVAHHLQKPSLYYIHESASVRHFFVPFQIPALVPSIEESFGLATRTVFSASATGQIHARLQRKGNYRVLPGWIDVEGIGRYQTAHTSTDLRRQLQLAQDAIIFVNIGSVTERKGQQVFIEAVDRLLRTRDGASPEARPFLFLLVGASPSFYVDILQHEIARLGLSQIQIISHVADARPYFRLADIFVCSSYEEALPRVVMEAAAFTLPIVSTRVNGIPEIINEQDGWLVPAGDAPAMANAMNAALDAFLRGDNSRAQRAHRKVCAEFAADTLLPAHTQLAMATAELRMD